MADQNDFPARGRVSQVNGSTLVFLPAGTNYELHLNSGAPYSGPVDQPIEAIIKVVARKLWTVPSGGNFIAPIFGQPRTIQGRVKWIGGSQIVVQAGTSFLVDLPAADQAIDLANGVIEVGTMVNVTALPGATFALAPAPVSR